MAGVGCFFRNNKTLYISGLTGLNDIDSEVDSPSHCANTGHAVGTVNHAMER